MDSKISIVTALALVLVLGCTASAGERELVVKKGEKIAFMGDSITAGGARKNGYITFVMDALNKDLAESLTKHPSPMTGLNRSYW